MKKNFMRITSLALVIALMLCAFAGCTTGNVEKPTAATIKTDLKDVMFTFTYGQLREVLPGDQLATLFETINNKTDDKTVSLSYYELVAKFGNKDYFDKIIDLISEEDMAKFVANQQAVLEYYNKHINEMKAQGLAKVSYGEAFWIDYDNVVFKDANGNELSNQGEFKAAFRIYADVCLQNIGSFLMNKGQDEALEKGADLTNALYPWGATYASSLVLDDLIKPTTSTRENMKTQQNAIYSSIIPTLVYDIDDKGNNKEDEHGENVFVATEYVRTICITVCEDEASVLKAFSLREKSKILDQFKVAESYLVVEDYSVAFNPCKIITGFDAVNDQITYATYDKNMIITAQIKFTGALAQYGTVTVEFPCTSSITYNFGW